MRPGRAKMAKIREVSVSGSGVGEVHSLGTAGLFLDSLLEKLATTALSQAIDLDWSTLSIETEVTEIDTGTLADAHNVIEKWSVITFTAKGVETDG